MTARSLIKPLHAKQSTLVDKIAMNHKPFAQSFVPASGLVVLPIVNGALASSCLA